MGSKDIYSMIDVIANDMNENKPIDINLRDRLKEIVESSKQMRLSAKAYLFMNYPMSFKEIIYGEDEGKWKENKLWNDMFPKNSAGEKHAN